MYEETEESLSLSHEYQVDRGSTQTSEVAATDVSTLPAQNATFVVPEFANLCSSFARFTQVDRIFIHQC